MLSYLTSSQNSQLRFLILSTLESCRFDSCTQGLTHRRMKYLCACLAQPSKVLPYASRKTRQGQGPSFNAINSTRVQYYTMSNMRVFRIQIVVEGINTSGAVNSCTCCQKNLKDIGSGDLSLSLFVFPTPRLGFEPQVVQIFILKPSLIKACVGYALIFMYSGYSDIPFNTKFGKRSASKHCHCSHDIWICTVSGQRMSHDIMQAISYVLKYIRNPIF